MALLSFIWWLGISFILVSAFGLIGLLLLIIIITLVLLLRDKTYKVESVFIAGNLIGTCLGFIMLVLRLSVY